MGSTWTRGRMAGRWGAKTALAVRAISPCTYAHPLSLPGVALGAGRWCPCPANLYPPFRYKHDSNCNRCWSPGCKEKHQTEKAAAKERKAQQQVQKSAPKRRTCKCGCWVMARDEANRPANLPEDEASAVAQGLVRRCKKHDSRSALLTAIAPHGAGPPKRCDACTTWKSHTCARCGCFRGVGAVRPCWKCVDNREKLSDSGPPEFPAPRRGKRAHCCSTCAKHVKRHRATYDLKRRNARREVVVPLGSLPGEQQSALKAAWRAEPVSVSGLRVALQKGQLGFPGPLAAYRHQRRLFAKQEQRVSRGIAI